MNVITAIATTMGTNHFATRSARRWMGDAAALCLADESYDLRQQSFSADALGLHDE